MTDKCQCYYTKSYEDDLGGYRSYQSPCEDPVYRAGRCLAHHKAYLHLLKCGIEYAKKKIHQDQIELIGVVRRSGVRATSFRSIL